jgi:TRAP-type C4-dicarboxylate transport system permease small subunit
MNRDTSKLRPSPADSTRRVVLRLFTALSIAIRVITTALAGLSLAAILLIVTMGVLARFIPSISMTNHEELAAYLLVSLVFFGLPSSFASGSFVRVSILFERFSPPVHRWVTLILTVIAVCYTSVLSWNAWQLVERTYSLGSISFGGSAIPLYLPQSAVSLGLSLFAAYLLVELPLQVLGADGARKSSSSEDSDNSTVSDSLEAGVV